MSLSFKRGRNNHKYDQKKMKYTYIDAHYCAFISLRMPSDFTRIVRKLDSVCESNIVGFGCLDALYKNGDNNI
jgi:hypothetical protein